MCASVACRRVRAEGSYYCAIHRDVAPYAYTCIQDGCAALVDDVEFCARHADEWNRAYMPAAEYEAARLDPYADRDVWDVWDDGGLERPGEDEP